MPTEVLPPPAPVEIFGRRASLYTRIALLFAETLHVPWRLRHIPDMTDLDTAAYGGNPALKLPVLRSGDEMVLGTENICRALAAMAAVRRPVHVVWPEHLPARLARNAQELVWHCATAQVQLAMGTIIAGLPADSVFFVKARTGIEGSLDWLERNLDDLLGRLPAGRDISLFEASLFCLIEHLAFRPTVSIAPYAGLNAFVADFAKRDAARDSVPVRARVTREPTPKENGGALPDPAIPARLRLRVDQGHPHGNCIGASIIGHRSRA